MFSPDAGPLPEAGSSGSSANSNPFDSSGEADGQPTQNKGSVSPAIRLQTEPVIYLFKPQITTGIGHFSQFREASAAGLPIEVGRALARCFRVPFGGCHGPLAGAMLHAEREYVV